MSFLEYLKELKVNEHWVARSPDTKFFSSAKAKALYSPPAKKVGLTDGKSLLKKVEIVLDKKKSSPSKS